MRKTGKFFKSKWEKITAKILGVLAIVLAVTGICNYKSDKNPEMDYTFDVGYDENRLQVEGETSYEKLSEDLYVIDEESHTISLNSSLANGAICLSDSQDGPTSKDNWYTINDEKTIEINEKDAIAKKYVYYLARKWSNR